jgi:protein-disulfide isomerase
MRKILFLLAIATSVVLGACAPTRNAPTHPDVVAKVNGRTIELDDVDTAIRPELARIESERYAARKAKLEEMIDDALLADEAKTLGITTPDLVKREITDKVKAPTDEDVKATFDELKHQTGDSFESLAPRIRDLLTQRAERERRREFLAGLRKKANVVVRLPAPRFTVDTTTGHSVGPADAPITLVEFSDYQCPYCGRSQATVDRVLQAYAGKIRHVFMDFPLTAIHPFAKQAAVASHCADEQGQWDAYHALLFAHQREFSADKFEQWAVQLKMDPARFRTCLTSGKYDSLIQKSLQAGESVGVSGTPGFFVNGIPIHGAQPFSTFESTIDEELAKAG